MSREDLLVHIERLRAMKVPLMDKIADIDRDVEILERAIEALDRANELANTGEGNLVPSAGQASPIEGCATMMEACHRLADMNGGLLRLTPAAREIRQVGLSKARTNASVSSTLHGYLRKQPDEWQHVGPGVWRRIAPSIGTNDADEAPSPNKRSINSDTGGENGTDV